MRICTLALAIAALATGSARAAAQKTFIDAQVSPKGTYVAFLSEENGKRTLTFFNLATHQGTFALQPEGESTIGRFLWANDERAVIEMVDRDGTLAAPVTRGEIYAVDANGKAGKVIFGYRAGEMQVGSHIKRAEAEWAWGFVISRLRNDPRHVLIAQYAFDDTGERFADICSLDVYSGLKTKLTRSPLPMDYVSFITDETGALRIASGSDVDNNPVYFWLEEGSRSWRQLTTLRGVSAKSEPLGFASADKLLYVSEPVAGGFGIFAVSIETGARKLLIQNESVPESGTVEDAAGHIVAVEYEPDLPTYELIQKDHPLSRALDGLMAARPNEHVHLINATDDGRKALVKVYSDRNPGEFLLVDTASLSAVSIALVKPWVKPEEMAEMSAFHIGASDGFRIHGYITLPKGHRAGAPPPLVVLPHGGPHFVRDRWAYQEDVQRLAHAGFAVLQVNFRGSGGYGKAYEEAGYRKWGTRMIDDILDATRFAVRKGFGDSKRICSYGASYGGYAAIQSAIAAPDLFRCAVGYAGIYDLGLLSKIGDIAERKRGRNYVRAAVGEDARLLEQGSPVRRAAELKAKVLLIHGKKDKRAPIEHAERLRDALASRWPPAGMARRIEGGPWLLRRRRPRADVRAPDRVPPGEYRDPAGGGAGGPEVIRVKGNRRHGLLSKDRCVSPISSTGRGDRRCETRR